jgi:hypothetical protein
MEHMASMRAIQGSGFDIRYPPGREFVKRMSNLKLHYELEFASGPLILTFAKASAEKGCEC